MSPMHTSESQANHRPVRLPSISPHHAMGTAAVLAGLLVWSLNSTAPALPALPTWSEIRVASMLGNDEPLVPDSRPLNVAPATIRDAVKPKSASVIPVRKLTKEQQTLAQFLAKRYRVALDSTQEFVDHAYKVARDMKLDPWLILAIMGIESSFDPNATSNKGAQGLMQVLTRVHADKFAPFGGVSAAFDPLANIKVGARILKGYIDRDGSIEAALKSYVGAAFMPDDRGYGEKVLTERERLAAVAQGRPMNELPVKVTSEGLGTSTLVPVTVQGQVPALVVTPKPVPASVSVQAFAGSQPEAASVGVVKDRQVAEATGGARVLPLFLASDPATSTGPVAAPVSTTSAVSAAREDPGFRAD